MGLPEKDVTQVAQVQFSKVAEFQRRGVIHYHFLTRVDGPSHDGQKWTPPRSRCPRVDCVR